MSSHRLCLYEDQLSVRAETAMPAANRFLFCAAGAIRCEISVTQLGLVSGGAIFSAEPMTIIAGPDGALVWRWELSRLSDAAQDLAAGSDVRSRMLLAAELMLDDPDGFLLRGDSVAFPPGGQALTHTHQGPGIRCLLEGSIEIDTKGESRRYGPGEAWFEAGPDPVFAQADPEQPTRFVRVLVLPRRLKGQPSIRYVNAEDRDKPKSQSYHEFADSFIEV